MCVCFYFGPREGRANGSRASESRQRRTRFLSFARYVMFQACGVREAVFETVENAEDGHCVVLCVMWGTGLLALRQAGSEETQRMT